MYGVVLMLAMTGAGDAPHCHRSCHGCYGGGCYGCYGCSSYYSCACSGWYGGHGCHGRHGCYGGCYGGGYGCYGSCYGCSCYGGYGQVIDSVPVAPMPPAPAPKPAPLPPPQTNLQAPATIQVSVPAQAVLFFDGVQMSSTSASRRFTTPTLENGKTYFYNVRAEIARDGQTVTTTQRVVVRAGEQTQVQFDFTPTGTLTARQD